MSTVAIMNAAVTITIPARVVSKVVRSIMENFPEASHGCVFSCVDYHYRQWQFQFEDGETGKVYRLDKARLLAAFPLLFTAKWPNGCTQPPGSSSMEVWDNWLGQSDAIDYDAFIQLACLGDVIYG